MYGHPEVPLERSKKPLPIEDLLDATKPLGPYPWDKETDMPVTVGGITHGGVLGSAGSALIRLFRSCLCKETKSQESSKVHIMK